MSSEEQFYKLKEKQKFKPAAHFLTEQQDNKQSSEAKTILSSKLTMTTVAPNSSNQKFLLPTSSSKLSEDFVDHHRAHVSLIKSSSVSGESSDAIEDSEEDKHVGPVMGIFFKVWSLVKVTKARHNKMRRQNSEDASQFHYIPGEQLRASQTKANYLLQDRHFRRAGSQPVQSSSVAAKQAFDSGLLLRASNSKQPTGGASSTASSGVSSSNSSTLAGSPSSVGRLPSRHSFRLAALAPKALAVEDLVGSRDKATPAWRERMKRNANQAGFESKSVNEEEKRNCAKENDDECESNDDDDEGSNDIYSTPNDSMKSVPSSAPLFYPQLLCNIENTSAANGCQYNPIIKSFSTNNFNQLLSGKQTPEKGEKFEPIEEQELLFPAELRKDPSKNKLNRLTSGKAANASRFFISSSSSEDSTNSPNQQQLKQQQQQQQQAFKLEQSQQQIPLTQSVHYHALLPAIQAPARTSRLQSQSGYKRSPSLFEFPQPSSRFSSKYPLPLQTFVNGAAEVEPATRKLRQLTNSVSLYDCKPINESSNNDNDYRLTQMLLEFGSNKEARDQNGCTALMQAVISDNLPAVKCLIERGDVNLNDTNKAGLSALDLVCQKAPTATRLEMLRVFVENKANLDSIREADNSRLLDRLISEHSNISNDKLAFVDCLLQNGAKLGSSTWQAARGKHDVQLRLLKKICQDGYFLYKRGSIEAAVYRFEYALKRLAELEQELLLGNYRHLITCHPDQLVSRAAKQIKYQVYLGLSRCERKRRFYKRALEFAHMAILVDSTSYEGYYSKAHILKDLGQLDDSLVAIEQTGKLVERCIEQLELELKDLKQQEENLIFDGCFNMLNSRRATWIESSRLELDTNLNYMKEARKYISRLKEDTLEDKLKSKTNVAGGDTRNDALIISSENNQPQVIS